MVPFIILTLLPMLFNGQLVIGSRYKPVAKFINIFVQMPSYSRTSMGSICVITQGLKESSKITTMQLIRYCGFIHI